MKVVSIVAAGYSSVCWSLRDDRDPASQRSRACSQCAAVVQGQLDGDPSAMRAPAACYVESALGEPANKVQLLALALDASGNVVGSV